MTDWENIPDDELDAILRKSAEGHHSPFNESEWNGLATQLIARRKKAGRIKVFSYLLAGLFVAAGFIFFRMHHSVPEKTDAPKADHPIKARETGEVLGSDSSDANYKPLRQNENPVFGVRQASDSSGADYKPFRQNENPVYGIRRARETTAPAFTSAVLREQDASENKAGNESRETGYTDRRLPEGSPVLIKREKAKLLSPVLHLPQINATVTPKSESARARQKGMSIRLLYSPDFSTIGTNKIFKAGSNAGVLGEYRFNRQWSVQAGVIKSLKYYHAYPDQYDSPYNPPSLKDIEAICHMLDIPLNLRYDLVNTAQKKWFVSAGVTSYLMLKEKYSYNYNYDASAHRKGWEGKTGFHPFGVANLSAGYERKLFRNFTIQAEPFLKIPLQNVGYGNVKLATFGLFISGKIELSTQPK